MSETWNLGTSDERQGSTRESTNAERELATLEQRLHVCWRDLAAAEQRGMPEHLLERRYAKYLRLLDAYVATQRRLRGRAPRSRLAS